MPDARRVFEEILMAASSGMSPAPMAVFDLDSTLFNVSHRTQKIIESFAREEAVRQSYPEEVSRLSTIKVEARDWGMKEAFLRAAFTASEGFTRAIRDYWQKHFFSSLFLHEDRPYPGAIEYVQELDRAGVQIYYLTGRDEKNMREGTLRSLAHWDLPLTSPEHLIMKPVKGGFEDEDFKDIQLRRLKTLASQIWFFENEPLIIHKVRESSPDVQIVWIDTTHSRKAQPPEGLAVIRAEWRHK